ncbi:RecF/RecN/SMC N terminal domain-containing protein [Neohortaea acidophila]|uniref:RecF/RecN/SMC N terminal domain-containing protein n=1 Tax=Neohortaea acidophila TaxID=245834 RepID=A0A6A6PNZ9_9PEZI|nr:RecF/RecN/SMC N terminal domain-containing protein [Neohortaea acidophila]KAF2481830.1 RecF/RecN/SMC N terminal domain-containing protein [Neohortaea acidophila]
MVATSPERPSRRAAARRKTVVEEEDGSDVENSMVSQSRVDEDEEAFTPPKKTRASPRRKTTGDATPRRRTTMGERRVRTGESVEPSQLFSPPESVVDEPLSPTKKSPPKRRSVKDARAARKSRASRISIASDAPELQPPLPTPQPSQSPEPLSRQGTPLTDITESAINEQTPTLASRNVTPPADDTEVTEAAQTPTLASRHITPPADETEVTEAVQTPKTDIKMEIKKVDAQVTKLDRPMDIVVKKRALGVPQSHEPAEPKERMTITYLTLTNFKSYAGRQVVGPFHASFSSVVGPNGSGKSNVIDSLLFVFGFRASKMRQGKLSALIHNSAQYPDLEYCEVEVHFQSVMDQPGGGSAVVPDSQLIICRRAFKNDSSKYYINGKTSNFTTVTTLLKDRGVDLDHKRFLILQGEVESIAQMKPKAANEHDDGLLEYLEDIIGTSKYKTPIDEAAAETESYNEVCLEKNTRVQHVEKEKNSLEDKKNKALAYIKDENELALKSSALYQIYVSECGDNIQVTQEAIGEIEGQLNEERKKNQGSEDEIKRLEKDYKAGEKGYDKLEKDTQNILKEVAKLDKETVKFEEKRKFLSNKAKKLEKTLETSNYGISESTTLAKNATDDIRRMGAEIEELEQEAATEDEKLSKIRESLKGKTQGLSDEIAAKQKQLEPWNDKVNEKQSAIAVAQSELDILREREDAGATAVADRETAKREELEGCKKEQKSAEKEVQSLNAQDSGFKSKLSGARQKADEARASLSATQSQGNESGRIDGFHGRLGNLGTIDQKYDVAISTACPQLDNLVQCVEYLRKNNLGRANFMLLNQLAQRDLSPKDTPEGVPRLFDLVKAKHDRFRPAFYSVLQDTLVAKDLEQADRIAYGARRWRVVTLDGQLIDKSGTMSGGGTKVAKGAMSAKLAADVTKEQVAKMEQEYARLQESQRELNARLKELQNRLPKLQTQAQNIERNIADAEKRIQELAAEAQPGKADKQRTGDLEKNIAKMQKETAGIEEEIKELQDKIMEIGGAQLRNQVNTLGESVSAAEKQGKKHEKASADAATELEKVRSELANAEDAQQALEFKKEELQDLKAQFDSRTAELNETRGLEENTKILADNEKRLNEDGEEREPEPMPELKELKGRTSQHVELAVLGEYRRRVEEYNARLGDLNTSLASRDAAKKRTDELRRLRLEGFMEGFSTISMRLKEMYQMITMGGNAELELVDSLDPFSEGILWKNISNLSGGEKTLSSLALPTPLYVMDEIDAALDFRNVSIVAAYIKERTKNAQFIVISLRNNMFELASRLVGVYKVNHMTKSVTVENRDYVNRQ